MNVAERNYPAHDKELLAIMHALAKWRVYLHGHPFIIYSDHATLTHLKNQPNLNPKQVRWLGKMQEFDFKIVHIPGKQNIVADTLSRQPDLKILTMTQSTILHDLATQIKQTLINDKDFGPILQTLQGRTPSSPVPTSLLQHYTLVEGILLYDQTRTCIPDGPLRTQILYDHHDAPMAGHQGIECTYAAIHNLFYWP
jgi:hypothetical protein